MDRELTQLNRDFAASLDGVEVKKSAVFLAKQRNGLHGRKHAGFVVGPDEGNQGRAQLEQGLFQAAEVGQPLGVHGYRSHAMTGCFEMGCGSQHGTVFHRGDDQIRLRAQNLDAGLQRCRNGLRAAAGEDNLRSAAMEQCGHLFPGAFHGLAGAFPWGMQGGRIAKLFAKKGLHGGQSAGMKLGRGVVVQVNHLRKLKLRSSPGLAQRPTPSEERTAMTGTRPKRPRKRVVAGVAAVLLFPALGWLLLVRLHVAPPPGEPMNPPFNLSDRLSTVKVEGDGERRQAVFPAKDGPVKMGAEEFLAELQKRQEEREKWSWLFRKLDITSWTSLAWIAFGFSAQFVFMSRMIIQWYVSEKAKSSVVPPSFWWLSLLGASMLIIYYLWRKDPVSLVAQSFGFTVYVRNLWLIHDEKARAAGQ